MKTTKFIANILVTLAAIAGAVYVVATYGEQIVAWCKKVLASLPCNCECKVEIVSEPEAEEEAVFDDNLAVKIKNSEEKK